MNPRIFVLALASFAVGTETYVFAGLLARLAADLQVTVALAGQLAAAFALTFAVCAPITAVLVARLDRKRVLVAALATLALLNVAAALMPAFGGLLAVRILCGVAATLVLPIASASAASLVPEAQRGKAMAVVLSGMTFAFLLGIPLGTVLGDLFGWRSSFLFSAGLTAMAAVVIAAVLPSVPSADQAGFRSLRVVAHGPVLRSLLFTVTAFTAMFCVIAFIGPVVTAISGIDGSGIGLMQSLVGIGSVMGIIVGGVVAGRPNSHRVVAATLALMALTLSHYSVLMLGWYPLHGPMPQLLLGLLIILGSASLFALAPVIQVRLIAAAPQTRNVVLALNGAMIFLGQGLGAVLGGATVAWSGLATVGLLGGAVAALGVLLALASERAPAAATARA